MWKLNFLKYVVCLLLSQVSISCQNSSGESLSSPIQVQDWPEATLEETVVHPDKIHQLSENLDSNRYENTHAILIIKGGHLVFEKYMGEYNSDKKHYTASVTKSVASAVLGIAIHKGALPGLEDGVLDKTLTDLFPKYAKYIRKDERKQKLRFKHLLTMSGGLQWDETSHPYDHPSNDWYQASRSKDPVKYVLEKQALQEPGSTFVYNGGFSIMLSHLIQRATGQSLLEYAKSNLFGPLGIADYYWDDIDCGLTDTDGGLYLRPRDMAKIGYLYLNEGKWKGTQLVAPDWIRESTRAHMNNSGMPDYGFQWWCGDFHYWDKKAFTYVASGHGGQKIFIFPEFDMVIVLTHQVFDNPFGEINNLAILTDYILPAVDKTFQEADKGEVPQDLEPYLGLYRSEFGQFDIIWREGELLGMASARDKMKLFPKSKDEFAGRIQDILDMRLQFSFHENGEVKGVKATFGFSEMDYEKI